MSTIWSSIKSPCPKCKWPYTLQRTRTVGDEVQELVECPHCGARVYGTHDEPIKLEGPYSNGHGPR